MVAVEFVAGAVALGMAVGLMEPGPVLRRLGACGVFFGGDLLIDRYGGSERKDAQGAQADGSPLAIVLGTVLDGIPESMVIGITIYEGGAVGAAYLSAVFISNLPESISSTAGLVASGWRTTRILAMWAGITLVSGVASLAGYGLFQGASPDVVAFVLAFAAGASSALICSRSATSDAASTSIDK